MTIDRYVVAGLAHVRSPWFNEVSRWSSQGTLPLEFIKCVSPTELQARIDSGRPFSAALLDARLPSVDRDLLHVLAQRQIAVIVVDDASSRVAWTALGARTTLPPDFDRAQLLTALADHAEAIDSVEAHAEAEAPAEPSPDRGQLIAVIGRSGAGASTIAATLAQSLATNADVILADLALNAHQAILHNAGDIVPGVQELVESHRSGLPSRDAVRDLTFAVPARGYQLLLGIRRHRDWSTLRPQALRTALENLRDCADAIVADVTGDLEGEAETGSIDVEDRNQLARMTVLSAELVVLVARPTLTGLHGLAVQLDELTGLGVQLPRIVVVVNRSPLRPGRRSEVARAIADITQASPDGEGYLGPLFVPERRGIEHIHTAVARFPSALTTPLGPNLVRFLGEVGPNVRAASSPDPVPVAPGELGAWNDEVDDRYP